MKHGFARILLVWITLSLGGCAALTPIDKRATDLNLGIGMAVNRGILLNLIRSSKSEPLYFISMSAAHGSATGDFKVGLPPLTLGPRQTTTERQFIFGTAGTSILDNNMTTSFDVGVLNSKDFYAGMMTPLQLSDVNLLLSQGYSRELVLLLVIESLKVTDVTDLKPGEDESHARSLIFYNDPRNRLFSDVSANGVKVASFEGFIYEAMIHGLTTEAFLASPEPPPASTTTESAGSAPGLKVYISNAPSTVPNKVQVRLCYDTALATPKGRLDFQPNSPRCGVGTTTPDQEKARSSKLPVTLEGRKLEIEVKTRSIFGIFRYLGELIRNSDMDKVHLHHYDDLPAESTQDSQLLTIAHRADSCFVSATYEGEQYCVPQAEEDNTKQIFTIINSLLALKTSPGDLPITQSVRLTP